MTVTGGVASFRCSIDRPGSGYTLTASAGSLTPAVSSSFQIQETTTTALRSSANPSLVGQPVSFTATVSTQPASAQTPGGTVTFTDGATTLGTATLDGSDTATYTTSALAAGSHQITAAYAGDTNDAPSTSSALTQTVNPDTPSGVLALTGQYVENSTAFQALSPQTQQAITTAIDDAARRLAQITPTLTPTQKARLIGAYDQTVDYLQTHGYLTADQATTLKTVAAGI